MKDGKLIRWSQPPGPTNALGQVKFVMYNPQNIYLHDTNARSRFDSRMRALSHGCVRTEHILDLATELLGDDGGEWTPDKIQAQLATGKTKQANFVKPLPVYIVYFSSAALHRRQDRRLQRPLWPRRQGDGGAQHEGRRGEPHQAQAGQPGRQAGGEAGADRPGRDALKKKPRR